MRDSEIDRLQYRVQRGLAHGLARLVAPGEDVLSIPGHGLQFGEGFTRLPGQVIELLFSDSCLRRFWTLLESKS
jgi:hypothetical protein